MCHTRTPDAFKAVASLDCAFRAVLIDVAQQHRATLIQGENWADDLAPTVLMNDEALTSGGERFASSINNLGHSICVLGWVRK